MESKYNPFEKRYPNRRKIIEWKECESEGLIEKHKNLFIKKDVQTLNETNKKLSLYIYDEEIQDNDFPTEFKSYGQIPNEIKKNLDELNIKMLTPIQKLSFAYLFNYKNQFFEKDYFDSNNYDLVGCAQTGSGKTIAYLIPSVSFLFNNPEGVTQITKGNNSNFTSYPLILIILPTRELAIQTYEECMKILYKTYINTVVVYGGEDYKGQIINLNEGCDILIGTPGRLKDFLSRGLIRLTDVKFVIIDEADKLLDMGFEKDINEILYEFDLSKNYNIFMFSATFPKKVLQMVDDLMRKDYSYITHGQYLGGEEESNKNIKQIFYYIDCSPTHSFQLKLKNLYNLLGMIDGKTLVFVNKKTDVSFVYEDLYKNDFGVVCIYGDMDMKERKYSLEEFKSGRVFLMIASDVASRGLDIPNVDYVINFDMPSNIDTYIHRIGRTGRVGNEGTSLTLLTSEDSNLFSDIVRILTKSGQKIPSFLYN